MNREKLERQLAIDEGRRALVYLDTVGKLTGGIGRNLTDRPFFDDEIALMLKNDIALVEQELDKFLPWWRQMSDARQRALANCCFNLGITRLRGFKKALAHLEAGQWEAAAAEFLNSKWAKQVGERSKRIAALIREG